MANENHPIKVFLFLSLNLLPLFLKNKCTDAAKIVTQRNNIYNDNVALNGELKIQLNFIDKLYCMENCISAYSHEFSGTKMYIYIYTYNKFL